MSRRCRPALGTFVEIAILDEAFVADAAFDAAFAAIDRVARAMSFHDPASDLSAINRDAARRWVRVDPWTLDVLAAAADLFARSGGRFDCAVAPVLIAGRRLPPGPSSTAPHPGATFADVVLDAAASSVAFRVPLCLDLGGIAKGAAVDRAIDALARHGATSAVVNAGGDLRVLGGRPVPIHLRRHDDAAPIRVGDLANGAFASSSSARPRARERAPGGLVDARRRRLIDDRRVHAVIAPTCLVADALTKVAATGGAGVDETLAAFGATALVH